MAAQSRPTSPPPGKPAGTPTDAPAPAPGAAQSAPPAEGAAPAEQAPEGTAEAVPSAPAALMPTPPRPQTPGAPSTPGPRPPAPSAPPVDYTALAREAVAAEVPNVVAQVRQVLIEELPELAGDAARKAVEDALPELIERAVRSTRETIGAELTGSMARDARHAVDAAMPELVERVSGEARKVIEGELPALVERVVDAVTPRILGAIDRGGSKAPRVRVRAARKHVAHLPKLSEDGTTIRLFYNPQQDGGQHDAVEASIPVDSYRDMKTGVGIDVPAGYVGEVSCDGLDPGDRIVIATLAGKGAGEFVARVRNVSERFMSRSAASEIARLILRKLPTVDLDVAE